MPQFELTTTDDDFELEDELAMDEDEDEDEEEDELYAAAYDEMVYRDSTDDGIDSELLGDGQGDTDYELELEARRLSDRLAFLTSLARFWKRTALSMMRPQQELTGQPPTEHLSHWTNQLLENRSRLITLLRAVAGHHVPLPGSDPVSMMEYDRRRMVKDALLDRIVVAYIASTEAAQFLMAAGAPDETTADEPELRVISTLLRAAVAGKAPAARQQYRKFVEHLENTPILYIPLAKGGDPQRAAVIRARQRALRLMLAILPRLGLLKETCQLIERCADVERHRPVGPGAVTEFDQLFRIGYQGMVDCLVTSSEQWQQEQSDDQQQASRAEADEELVEYLQHLTELMMERWLEHSRTVRLSVLEKIANQKQWKGLRKFIQQYGHELFDQSFFHLGNLRAILHRGVDAWLDELAEIADEQDIPLLAVLHDTKARQNAVHQLQLIMESIVENYVEYRDYNGTTTQSDRGELLFTLLDMLRLRVSYDRVAWNLMPVSLAHEVLVRRGHTVAAEFWRREMARRTSEMADQLLDRFSQLQREYGMRLQTVAVRVKERFVRPLLVDRAVPWSGRPSLRQPDPSPPRRSNSSPSNLPN